MKNRQFLALPEVKLRYPCATLSFCCTINVFLWYHQSFSTVLLRLLQDPVENTMYLGMEGLHPKKKK